MMSYNKRLMIMEIICCFEIWSWRSTIYKLFLVNSCNASNQSVHCLEAAPGDCTVRHDGCCGMCSCRRQSSDQLKSVVSFKADRNRVRHSIFTICFESCWNRNETWICPSLLLSAAGDPDAIWTLINHHSIPLAVLPPSLRKGVLSAGAAAARQVPRRARQLRRTRPSSGWKLLKQLPLLQLPQPVLPTVLVQPIDEPVTLVDCGSGSTRALFFKDDGLSHVSWEKSNWRGWTVANFTLVLPCILWGEKIL